MLSNTFPTLLLSPDLLRQNCLSSVLAARVPISLFSKIMSILVIQYFGQLPSHANLWISERWERTIKFQSMISYYSLLCNLQRRGNALNLVIIHIESLLYFNTISLRTIAANSQSKGAQFNNLIYSIFMAKFEKSLTICNVCSLCHLMES